MTSYFDDPDSEIRPLPQCGFGADVDFNTLIQSNRFLFRVYTPKERSPFYDDTEPFFVAPRFDEQFVRSPVDLPKVKFSEPFIGSYADVARHMEWTTRSTSSYISTSFSFSWSIWEAVRRYYQGVKKDVEIAIIDSTALGGRAATAIQLMQKSTPSERTEQYWKWYRFSQDSQSVLVYGMIPRTAVLASVPLIQILRKMPSYFLRQDVQIISGNPLDLVAWNFALRKHNYRQFCQDMSKLFLARPAEVRLRDSTAGCVRLALSFLRPFFHRVVQSDFEIAISYLRNLSITISQWPGGEWLRDHKEIRRIIDSMVLALAEELREKYLDEKQEEMARLQLVINGLQQEVDAQKANTTILHLNLVDDDSDDEFAVDFGESEEPTLVTPSVLPIVEKPSSLYIPIVTVQPRIPPAFQTPITPPESPRNSLFVTAVSGSVNNVIPSPLAKEYVDDVGQASNEVVPVEAPLSAVSEEPASPPPTPPVHSTILPPVSLSPIEEEAFCEEEETPNGQEWIDSSSKDLVDQTLELLQDDAGCANKHDTSDPLAQENLHGEVSVDALHYGDDLSHTEDEDDGEETELEPETEHEHYLPPTSSNSWAMIHHVRPKVSSFSSTHSSIASMDTLIDPGEGSFHLKRLSITSADSFEFVPPYSSFRSFNIPSQTVSFSEPPSRAPLTPILNPVDIPLPPSPIPSLDSICLTSSLSSASSHLSSTPASPRSQSASLESRSSSPSPLAQHSVQSSTHSSPHSSPSSATTPLPLELHLPVIPAALLIPPKARISLLSPLPEAHDVDDEDEDDPKSKGVRPTRVVETASYLVGGFLVGAFITLFLFSTQRRQLLALT
ncbi:hypothetical protein JR316_0013044 [Psilocybe cubensis]|uniref:DUF7587 domain-containing protein n=2 Tax=Psilocybe cubensis TaxID=181762 RepID=A0A8H8CHZ3_PSICU|nr:hypothetical protein JR316_0013044 [Psilocybe cubensis]KAH9474582.1 hypothetical protein JR316_0013044 [Psilocybe cubensis]